MWKNTLLHVKYCIKASASFFLLTCKCYQGTIKKHCGRKTSGNIILDCLIKICDGWVAIVEFLWETKSEKTHMAKSLTQLKMKDVNILHAKLGDSLNTITGVKDWDIGFHINHILKPCEDCVLGKPKKMELVKRL